MTPQQQAGAVFALGVVLPAFALSGVFPGSELVPLPIFAVVALAAGAGGTWLGTRRRPLLSVVLGGLGGVGSLLAIPPYVEFRSRLGSTLFVAEVLLPVAVVALPLMAIWKAIDSRRP